MPRPGTGHVTPRTIDRRPSCGVRWGRSGPTGVATVAGPDGTSETRTAAAAFRNERIEFLIMFYFLRRRRRLCTRRVASGSPQYSFFPSTAVMIPDYFYPYDGSETHPTVVAYVSVRTIIYRRHQLLNMTIAQRKYFASFLSANVVDDVHRPPDVCDLP